MKRSLRQAVLRAALLVATHLTACQSPSDTVCDRVTCEPGSTCIGGDCFRLCVNDSGCPSEMPVCAAGICIAGAGTGSCDAPADCTTPAACESATGARCDAGTCVYAETECRTPPSNDCKNASTFRSFGSRGSCDPGSGTCGYPAFELPCPSCATTCLPDCAALDCTTTPNTCLDNGRCNPEPTAQCEYDFVADATPCVSGGNAGQCAAGMCLPHSTVGCTHNSSCAGQTCLGGYCRPTSPPGSPCDTSDDADCGAGSTCVSQRCRRANGGSCTSNTECLNTCIGGICSSVAGLGGTCDNGDPLDCSDDLACGAGTCKRAEGAGCSGNSECAGTCIGGFCAPLATSGSSCDPGDEADCTMGGTCIGGTCAMLDGQFCADDFVCANTCIGGVCAPRVGPATQCDSDFDCTPQTPALTCTDSRCVWDDGDPCTDNNQCVSACVTGECAPPGVLQSTCDSDDDGDCAAGLICAGTVCKRPTGSACSADAECEAAECECTDSTCTPSAKVCATSDCPCKVWTGTACGAAMADGSVDPEDCTTDGYACTAGACRTVNPGTCACNQFTTCPSDCSAVCAATTPTTNGCGSGWTAVCGGSCTPYICLHGSCSCQCGMDCTCQAL